MCSFVFDNVMSFVASRTNNNVLAIYYWFEWNEWRQNKNNEISFFVKTRSVNVSQRLNAKTWYATTECGLKISQFISHIENATENQHERFSFIAIPNGINTKLHQVISLSILYINIQYKRLKWNALSVYLESISGSQSHTDTHLWI